MVDDKAAHLQSEFNRLAAKLNAEPVKVGVLWTTAKSHNIIRSSQRAVHVATSAWAQGWSGPPIVPLLFIESERSCLRGGQTRDSGLSLPQVD
jgi:hypothetical protein